MRRFRSCSRVRARLREFGGGRLERTRPTTPTGGSALTEPRCFGWVSRDTGPGLLSLAPHGRHKGSSILKVRPSPPGAGRVRRFLYAGFGVLLLCAAGRAAGAQTVAGGRVVRPSGSDSIPVAGVRVLLHRVRRAAPGPVD